MGELAQDCRHAPERERKSCVRHASACHQFVSEGFENEVVRSNTGWYPTGSDPQKTRPDLHGWGRKVTRWYH